MAVQMTEDQIEQSLKGFSDEYLGKLLKDYVTQANRPGYIYWGEFNSRDMTGIRRFFVSLLTFEMESRHDG